MRSLRSERGTAMVPLLVVGIICGALAVSVLMPNIGRHNEAQVMIERERAFHLAEAGIDWGIAEIRIASGVPSSSSISRTPGNGTSGSFTVTFTAGDANGVDDDGDTFVDDSDEAELVQMVSTGTYGDSQRTIEVMMRRSVATPTIAASIQFNVENPIVDMNGNAFFVSGNEHLIDGTEDNSRSPGYGLGAPTDASNLSSQIASNRADQVVGAGGTPSVTRVDAIDLDTLVEQAKSAATHSIATGTHSQLSLGSPTPGGVVIAVAEGDLHLSGQAEGYGVLVIDGDLKCSGQLLWTGIIIVRGRCDMTGGGSGKRLIGAMIVGEEVLSGSDTQTVKVTGTVDMLYSTDAVELAQSRLAMMTVLSWQETANP